MPFSEKIAKIYLNRRGSSSLRSSAGSKKKVQKSQKSKTQKSKSPTREISNLSEIRTEGNNLEISKEMSEISIERVAKIHVCYKKFTICIIFRLTLFYLYIYPDQNRKIKCKILNVRHTKHKTRRKMYRKIQFLVLCHS